MKAEEQNRIAKINAEEDKRLPGKTAAPKKRMKKSPKKARKSKKIEQKQTTPSVDSTPLVSGMIQIWL